ncbi:MAG: hypothetical protein JNL79_06830 [Myxococcales bacterium]|nr:hypothetical protein [Myxococcales bacterium]
MRAAAALFALLGVALASGCGGTAKEPRVAEPAPVKKPAVDGDRSGFAGTSVTPHHSARLGLTIPLPDRAAWQIVDLEAQQGGWLVATHGPTHTVVRARRFDEVAPVVGRKECEQRAIVAGELPNAVEVEKRGFETLSDESLHRPKGWDGRRWVAFEPAPGGLVGHVFLVTGRARSCLVVHVVARVNGDAEANILADRLELFASRVVGAVTVDTADPPTMGGPTPP